MFNYKVSPQKIIILLVSFSLTPRLLSSFAFEEGTLYILLFWVPFLVLFPEFIKGYSHDIPIRSFPKLTIFLILITLIIILFSLFNIENIYSDSQNPSTIFVRRISYLIHPLMVLSFYKLVSNEKFFYYMKLMFLLTICISTSMSIPTLISGDIIGNYLNHLTAIFSAFFSSLGNGDDVIKVDGNIIWNSTFKVVVKDGCSSINQIILSLNALLIMNICCKIKAKIKLILLVFLAFFISFILNAIRITLLSKALSVSQEGVFNFWHDGPGSLIFSFVTMTMCATAFYFFWSSENPQDKFYN